MLLGLAIAGRHFLNLVITGDKSCVYKYDIELKLQSHEWKQKGEPCPKKARRSRLNIKTMVIVFFNIRGVMHHKYIPCGQTSDDIPFFHIDTYRYFGDSHRYYRYHIDIFFFLNEFWDSYKIPIFM